MIEKVRAFCPLPEKGQEEKICTVHKSLFSTTSTVYGHLATEETRPFDGSNFISDEMV